MEKFVPITMRARLVKEATQPGQSDDWTVSFTCEQRTYTAEYHTGVGHRQPKGKSKKVSAYFNTYWNGGRYFHKSKTGLDIELYPVKPEITSVLECLASDRTYGEVFEDWCWNLGYDTDSRKALETYLACQASEVGTRKLLGKHLWILDAIHQGEHPITVSEEGITCVVPDEN